jgi:hypothetical protein
MHLSFKNKLITKVNRVAPRGVTSGSRGATSGHFSHFVCTPTDMSDYINTKLGEFMHNYTQQQCDSLSDIVYYIEDIDLNYATHKLLFIFAVVMSVIVILNHK